ncbi:hypothetical protein II906_11880 [bacterium]|nr:hypothetical protein [bacterium]
MFINNINPINYKKVSSPSNKYTSWVSFSAQGDVFCHSADKLPDIKNIPNIHFLPNNSLRGESLSSPRNRRFLPSIRQYGIENVLDLRNSSTSDKYPKLCEDNGLNYYYFPVDSFSVPDDKIIKNMPRMFELMNKGKYYIACALGLHRTDIAISLNYIFNPKEQAEIPVLWGHERDFGLKVDDISRRLHSVKNKIKDEDLKDIGWQDRETFENEFESRKSQLYDFNRKYISKKDTK